MVDFARLRQDRGSSLEKLHQELSKMEGGGSKTADDRLWYPTVDKAGNGYAVVRFLPAPGEEEVPFVRVFDHGFKGPSGLWYIENSLTTLGQKDPVTDFNSQLWNSTTDDNSPARKQARDQKRRLSFISNVYIITDSQNPENEGKVKIFKYGKKIFDKLNEAMNPQFADEKPMNPFDLWEGSNFKIKIRNVEGYRNYDKSEFDKPGPLFKDDDKLEAIWRQEHSLQAFLDPSNFKSYDELRARLHTVLGLDKANPVAARQKAAQMDEDDAPPARQSRPMKEKVAQPTADEDDDDLSFFKRLAEDD